MLFYMNIYFKPFKKEVVEIGDIYLFPVGGFSLQPTMVYEINDKGFKYRNRFFVDGHEFLYGLKRDERGGQIMMPHDLGGILEKFAKNKLL